MGSWMVFCEEQELSHCTGEEEGFDLLTLHCADVTGLSLLQGADLEFMHLLICLCMQNGF